MLSFSGYVTNVLKYTFDKCLHQYFSTLSHINIIQVGANDGEKYDPVAKLISQFPCQAILVEPLPNLCDGLNKKYHENHQIKVLQKAITAQNNRGALPFFHFEEKHGLPFNSYFTLWGSFSREHLEKFRDGVPHFDELLTCTMIPTMGINELFAGSGFEQVDYLQVDAEGYDEQLISALDLDLYKPTLIRFEHTHSNRQKVFGLLGKLGRSGYQTYSLGMDTICISGPGQKYFHALKLIKALHSNWLEPAKTHR